MSNATAIVCNKNLRLFFFIDVTAVKKNGGTKSDKSLGYQDGKGGNAKKCSCGTLTTAVNVDDVRIFVRSFIVTSCVSFESSVRQF